MHAVNTDSANVGTSFLPESGVPDATAFFPLNALTSAGSEIITRGGHQSLQGTINNTAR